MAKVVDGVMEQGWLYQDGLNPVAELDGSGQVVSRFVYGTSGHVPTYMLKDGVTYALLSDVRGSVRRVVEVSTGAVVQELEYSPFGRVLVDTNPGFQPFGYAGGLYDVDTGLVRFGARDYDGGIGRWTAKDPIGFSGGDANLYGYVLADPVNGVDPSGLDCESKLRGRDGLTNEQERSLLDYISNDVLGGHFISFGESLDDMDKVNADIAKDEGGCYSTEDCEQTSLSMRKAYRGAGVVRLVSSSGGPLPLRTGVPAPEGGFDFHSAVKLRSGEVLDPFFGRKYGSVAEWAKAIAGDSYETSTMVMDTKGQVVGW